MLRGLKSTFCMLLIFAILPGEIFHSLPTFYCLPKNKFDLPEEREDEANDDNERERKKYDYLISRSRFHPAK